MPSKKRKAAWGSDAVESKKMNLNWKCEHCELAFRQRRERDEHTDGVHRCRKCWKILQDSDKKEHAEMHEREEAEEKEAKRKEVLFYDDFVEKFIRTKKLDEYPSIDELDLDYIYENYRDDIDDEQLLFLVKHGMYIDFIEEEFDDTQIIHYLENEAISEEDAENFIDHNTHKRKQLIEYFLEKNYAIEPSWVVEFLNDNALIARIKEKHDFTFEDIFEAANESNFDSDQSTKYFYKKVHAHFPDPNYKEPPKYECITTQYVDDYLHSRYHYDEENDQLLIRVGHDNRKISLGCCKDLIENDNNLAQLIAKYRHAIEQYDIANKKVSDHFAKLDEVSDDDDDEYERYDFFGDRNPRKGDYEREVLYDDLYQEYIPDRNYWANIVSHTYFVIAKKSPGATFIPTLEYLAMQTVAKNQINFDRLPSSLKLKVAKMVSDE